MKESRKTIKKVLRYIGKYSIYLAFALIFAAITVALTLYLPILTGNALDLIIEKGLVDFTGIYQILRQMALVILLTDRKSVV